LIQNNLNFTEKKTQAAHKTYGVGKAYAYGSGSTEVPLFCNIIA
jgi:alanine racemase